MSIVETIAAAVKPWNELYANSKPISEGVLFVHLGSLLVGGGFAVASDRMALRARSGSVDERRRLLDEFAGIHRPVIIALCFMAASGLAMLLADVETFLPSPVYWTKMTLVALLLANGYLVTRTERALTVNPSDSNPLWGRLTAVSIASLTLWLSTTLMGVILAGS